MKIGRGSEAVRLQLIKLNKADRDAVAESLRQTICSRNDAHRQGQFAKVKALAARERELRSNLAALTIAVGALGKE